MSFLSYVKHNSSLRSEDLAEVYREQGIQNHDPLGLSFANVAQTLAIKSITTGTPVLQPLLNFADNFFDDGEKEKKYNAKNETDLLATFNKYRKAFNDNPTSENARLLKAAFDEVKDQPSVQKSWNILGPRVSDALKA